MSLSQKLLKYDERMVDGAQNTALRHYVINLL